MEGLGNGAFNSSIPDSIDVHQSAQGLPSQIHPAWRCCLQSYTLLPCPPPTTAAALVFNAYMVAYTISPRTCHAFVGVSAAASRSLLPRVHARLPACLPEVSLLPPWGPTARTAPPHRLPLASHPAVP